MSGEKQSLGSGVLQAYEEWFQIVGRLHTVRYLGALHSISLPQDRKEKNSELDEGGSIPSTIERGQIGRCPPQSISSGGKDSLDQTAPQRRTFLFFPHSLLEVVMLLLRRLQPIKILASFKCSFV